MRLNNYCVDKSQSVTLPLIVFCDISSKNFFHFFRPGVTVSLALLALTVRQMWMNVYHPHATMGARVWTPSVAIGVSAPTGTLDLSVEWVSIQEMLQINN